MADGRALQSLAVREKTTNSDSADSRNTGMLSTAWPRTEEHQDVEDVKTHANVSPLIDSKANGQANAGEGDEANVQALIVTDPADLPEEKKKKRKKRPKPASKRGMVSIADARIVVSIDGLSGQANWHGRVLCR